jgi:hypothetical protein
VTGSIGLQRILESPSVWKCGHSMKKGATSSGRA